MLLPYRTYRVHHRDIRWAPQKDQEPVAVETPSDPVEPVVAAAPVVETPVVVEPVAATPVVETPVVIEPVAAAPVVETTEGTLMPMAADAPSVVETAPVGVETPVTETPVVPEKQGKWAKKNKGHKN